MQLNKILNILNSNFKELDFNEQEHRYTVGISNFIPVSNEIKNFYKQFDYGIAVFVAKKQNKTTDEVLKEWEYKRIQSAKKGSDIHLFGENIYKFYYGFIDIFYYGTEFIKEKENLLKFFVRQLLDGLIPIASEYRMYDKQLEIAGTLDLLWYDTKTNSVILDDYKTNENLFKQYKNQKLLEPFGCIDDTPYSKYMIQLSYYQMMLENIGINNITKRRLIHITDKKYTIYDRLTDLTSILKNYYENKRSNSESSVFVF